MSTLRKNIDIGLAAMSGNIPGEAPSLDESGRAHYELEIPDMQGETVVIGLQLGRAEKSFVLSARLCDIRRDVTDAALRALLELNAHMHSARGAAFAVDEATEGLSLVYHWPVSSVSPEQFQELFELLSVQAMLWGRRFLQGDHDDPRLSGIVRMNE